MINDFFVKVTSIAFHKKHRSLYNKILNLNFHNAYTKILYYDICTSYTYLNLQVTSSNIQIAIIYQYKINPSCDKTYTQKQITYHLTNV